MDSYIFPAGMHSGRLLVGRATTSASMLMERILLNGAQEPAGQYSPFTDGLILNGAQDKCRHSRPAPALHSGVFSI
jgi:hypothetical protein